MCDTFFLSDVINKKYNTIIHTHTHTHTHTQKYIFNITLKLQFQKKIACFQMPTDFMLVFFHIDYVMLCVKQK